MEGAVIDLKKRFGRRYRIEHEESYHAENRRGDVPELMILLCRYGHIYPHGGRLLAASVDGYPKVAGKVRRLACVDVIQDGDFGELTAVFDVDDSPKVAKIMRPRRRRHVTAKQREQMVARLNAARAQIGREKPNDGEYRERACVSADRPESKPPESQRALFEV